MNKTQFKGHIGLCQYPKCFRKATHILRDNEDSDFIIHFCEGHYEETIELLEKLNSIFEPYEDNISGLPIRYLLETKEEIEENRKL